MGNYKKTTLIIILLAILIVLFAYGQRVLFQMDWKIISSATSPDGMFTIRYYQSLSVAGHAPYGDNLMIESARSFPKTNSGETFFAGYCGKNFSFKWEGNEKIIIHCAKTSSQSPIRTQTVLVNGINVEVIK